MADDTDDLKAEGDALFRAARFDEAALVYGAAIEASSSAALVVQLLSNLAACFLQLRQYDECIQTCSRILESHDAGNSKALLRRAQCYEISGELDRAMRDVGACEGQGLPPSLARKAAELRNRIRALQRRDADVLATQPRPDRLVNVSQTLRLQLLRDCPRQLAPDDLTAFGLSTGNEFGLFNRDCMLGPEPAPRVTCEVLVLGLGSSPVPLAPTCTADAVVVGSDGRASVGVKLHARGTPPSTRFLLKFSLTSCLPSGAAVAPIYSLPMVVASARSSVEADKSEGEDDKEAEIAGLSASCIRGIALGCDLTVYGYESPGLLGIGGKLWDSTYVLLKYLEKNTALLAGKRVAELGAGTGIAGVACACMCPSIDSVVITDFSEVTPLIAANIRLNAGMQGRSSLTERCRAQAYAWGSEPMGCDVDVVIASDVVYDPVGYLPLVESLCSLLSPPNSGKMCVLAYRSRHPEEFRFFELLTEHALELLPQDLDRPASSGPSQRQQLEDVKIFHICAR